MESTSMPFSEPYGRTTTPSKMRRPHRPATGHRLSAQAARSASSLTRTARLEPLPRSSSPG